MPAELPLVASPITGGDPRGVDSADALARLVAKELGLDHPARERVSMNAVYRCGTAVIRVSRPTVDPIVAIDTAHFLLDKRIPTAVPFVDRSFHDPHIDPNLAATVWRHIDIDSRARPNWRDVGTAIRALHSLDPSEISDRHPLPRATRFPWWNVPSILDEVAPSMSTTHHESLSTAWARLRWAIEAIDEHPSHPVVVHGDLHPGNVVVERTTKRTVILDWDLLSSSSVVWDHAPLMRWTSRWSERSSKVSDPYLEFSEGYGTSLIDDPLAEALAELRLLVATLMRAKSAMNDPTGRAEATKRLGYWTGEDDRPWNAV